MKKAIVLVFTIAFAGCSDWRFDSSDDNSRIEDSFHRNKNGQIVPAPTPSSEDEIDEVLND